MSENGRGYLDNIWASGGTNRLRRMFNTLAVRDAEQALRMLRDDRLSFPVFFILMKDIDALRLSHGLSPRLTGAMNVCAQKIRMPDRAAALPELYDSDTLYLTLKWMLHTGIWWDGPKRQQDDYDAVIDYVSALLIVIFEDKTILPEVIELIFRRNRNGLYSHDLVWSFFQTLDVDALILIAGNLLSRNPKDVELTCKLLDLDIEALSDSSAAKEIYTRYVSDLVENRPYLYLTGEHLQMTSAPRHVAYDLEAKYLGKEILPRYRAPVEPLTEDEAACLYRYRRLAPAEQKILTDYSHRLRSKEMRLWDEWMQKQITEQVIRAKAGYEVI